MTNDGRTVASGCFAASTHFGLAQDAKVVCLLPTPYLVKKQGGPSENRERVCMSDLSRQRLLNLFKTRAVSFGRFKLTSGKESTYYINSKKMLFNSEAVWLLGDVLWDLTMNLDIQAIGGLEIGAIPMATTAVLHHHMHGRTVEGFFVRKQLKEHGSKQRVEGLVQPGFRVAIVDDVFTQGTSVQQAITEVE